MRLPYFKLVVLTNLVPSFNVKFIFINKIIKTPNKIKKIQLKIIIHLYSRLQPVVIIYNCHKNIKNSFINGHNAQRQRAISFN